MSDNIEYSEKYCDDYFEYRHVTLPKELKSQVPSRLLEEKEWREIGVTQSRGWIHYMIHKPEPHILLFRRPIGTDAKTGQAPVNWTAPSGVSDKELRQWIPNYMKNKHKN